MSWHAASEHAVQIFLHFSNLWLHEKILSHFWLCGLLPKPLGLNCVHIYEPRSEKQEITFHTFSSFSLPEERGKKWVWLISSLWSNIQTDYRLSLSRVTVRRNVVSSRRLGGKNNSKDKENNITYWNKICQADDTSQKLVAALNRQYVVADILGPQ